VYACDYFETALGFYSRMVKGTKATAESFCYAVVQNEFMHRFSPVKDATNPTTTVRISSRVSFSVSTKLLPKRRTDLKSVSLNIGATQYHLKPFSISRQRDSSAVTFFHQKINRCGRIKKIIFDPNQRDKSQVLLFEIQAFARFQASSPHPFPRHFGLYALGDSETVVVKAECISSRVMLMDAPGFLQWDGVDLVILTRLNYRLS
jgi:hypothetical protein